jgi:hypothetical protein
MGLSNITRTKVFMAFGFQSCLEVGVRGFARICRSGDQSQPFGDAVLLEAQASPS